MSIYALMTCSNAVNGHTDQAPHFSTADLQALKEPEEKASGGDGIETPGHAHHFANKGIDPEVLQSSLKKHIALGAHQGERRLNDFSAHPTDRLNPHFTRRWFDVSLVQKKMPQLRKRSNSCSLLLTYIGISMQ